METLQLMIKYDPGRIKAITNHKAITNFLSFAMDKLVYDNDESNEY